MNLIGIDFSKNSTGVTLLFNNNYYFFSFTKDYSIESHKKKCQHHYNLNENISDCNVFSYSLLPTTSKDNSYSINEYNKITNGNTIASSLAESITEFIYSINDNKPIDWTQFKVAIEGYSYGSKGNILIDLVTMCTIVKDKFTALTFSPVEVYAPTEIKSFAGNGRADKCMMFDYFLNDTSLNNSQFHDYCKDIIIEKNKVPKPLDDIIDSFFVLKLLQHKISL